MVADSVGGLGRSDTGVNTAGRGREHLAQGNLRAGHILSLERLQVGADKASEQGGSHVVRVALFL